MAFAKISTAITIYRIVDNPVLRRVLTQRTASRDRYNYLQHSFEYCYKKS